MSYPMLRITLSAYFELKSKYVNRLNVITENNQNIEEQYTLSSKISILNELINAIVPVIGCMDQNVNG